MEFAMKPQAAGGGLYGIKPSGAGLAFEGTTRSGIEVRGFANSKYGLDTIFPIRQP